jgi:hypothetical protein
MNPDSLDTNEYIVMGSMWKVREVPGGDPRIDDDYGKTDFVNYTIWICRDLKYFDRLDTLIHETTHVIVAGRDRVSLLVEDDVRWFTTNLLDTLIRNDIQLKV